MGEQQKISCLMLAAGFSRRMGKPKLALPLGKSTVLERSVQSASEVPFWERLLIVREKAKDFPGFRTIEIGSQAELGIHRSIRAGIEALAPCEAVCICLADQPFLTPQDYGDLFRAWAQARKTGKNLLYPENEGKRGNPATISSEYFCEILKEPDKDSGCQYLFRRYPESVYSWQAPSPGFYRDLDDWEAYQACLN